MTAGELGLKPQSQNARVWKVLADGQPHTIADIHFLVGTCRLNSRVAEIRRRLREHGRTIACWQAEGTYVYQVVDLASGSLDETGSERGDDGGHRSARTPGPSRRAPLPQRTLSPGRAAASPARWRPPPSPPARDAQQSLDESIREDLDAAYLSLDRLHNAVPVSTDADVRRWERVRVVERQIREMEASLQGRERTAA